jgi:TolA-binding protein
MHPNSKRITGLAVVTLIAGAGAFMLPLTASAQGKPPAPAAAGDEAPRTAAMDRTAAAASGELEARRLLDLGKELLDSGERDRGIKMIETVIAQFPASRSVYPACLTLGRHYIRANEKLPEAIGYLNRLRPLEPENKLALGEDREWFLEAMYLTGMAYFQTRQYTRAFPVLRHITSKYPNTLWANQAYYYIGMCHFAQENWSKAIEALSLVGTFVDPDSPTISFAEAGRRFYVKVEDADFPVMLKMGKKITMKLATDAGDKETVECALLTPDAQILICSIPTAIGVPLPGDRVLQVVGGERVTASFVDESTKDGAGNVLRTAAVRMVSTGSIDFMMGDLELRAPAAYLAQPLFIQVIDADLDTGDKAETLTLSVISRYKVRAEDEAQSAFAGAGAVRYQTRDRVDVKLVEQSTNAVFRSGRFAGQVNIVRADEALPADQSDNQLACCVGDEVYVAYTDNLHIQGDMPRVVDTLVTVAGEINNTAESTTDVVFDPVLRARKNLVEATAYLELARIFKSMGLMGGTIARAAEGITRVEAVIRSDNRDIGEALKQEAFKAKWELHIEAGQLAEAMATCATFSTFYPDSPLVADALLGVAKIRLEEKQYAEAIQVLQQITQLASANMDTKSEAQFEIAKTQEIIFQINLAKTTGKAREALLKAGDSVSIQSYMMCVQRYPKSTFAGPALGKVVDYYIAQNDLTQANSLLEQTFQDYPDALFLDAMLMKWVLVTFQMGDFAKAQERCKKLLLEYPDSPHAETARKVLPQIEARLM